MSFIARTKDSPGDVGRALDQQQSVDNENALYAMISGDGRVIREVIVRNDIPDNTATEIFQIITAANGGLGGGFYACEVKGAVGHYSDQDKAHAAKAFSAAFARGMGATTGVASAVTEDYETASGASTSGTRDLTTVTMTVAEVDEFTLSVLIQIDLTGTTVNKGAVVFAVQLSWYGFAEAPQIVQV